MKRALPLILIAFLVVNYSAAQDAGQHSMKRFGVRLGVNYSGMNFNKGYPPPDSHVAVVWMAGITAGFLLAIPLVDKLSVNPEYAYARMRGKDERSGTTYKLNYLSMPVFLTYRIAHRIAIKAGPQLDLLINAKKNTGTGDQNITHDTEERNVGVAAGVEIKLVKNIYLEARYMQGLNHIGIGQRSNTTEFTYQLVQLNASFRF